MLENFDPETNGESKDIVAGNIAQLKQLFPEVFTEDKVDFTALKVALGNYIETSDERYNFTWHGKAQAKRIAQTPSTGTLRPCKKESKNWDTTQNLFIEGDNLEVLKLLQKAYHKQVKMIYIDPPYNTGKEFIYPDNYQDNLDTYLEYTGQKDSEGHKFGTNADTSGRYHTNWLNMMYPRLKLARNLLQDDGVIFISIDDNEVANLRRLCDEIFGEENFRGLVSRPTGTPSGQGYDILVNEIDYVMVYSKSLRASLLGLPFSKDDEKIYDQTDEHGQYLTRTLRKTGGEDRRQDRPTMYYGIKAPDGSMVYPIGPTGYESRWRCGEEAYWKLVDENRIEWKQSDNGWKPYQKFYLEGRLKQPSNLWQGIEGNKKASLTVKELFNRKVFDTPKPVELIERCLQISTTDDDLVLDFFSGSCSSAHGVMRLNAHDKSSRRFIMVQLPEPCNEKSEAFSAGYKTIADIGKERINLAGNKIKADNPAVQGVESLDIGFKVFKLDSSNIKPWDADFQQLEDDLYRSIDNIKKDDRTSEDVLYELLLKYGIDLTIPIENHTIAGKIVYSVGLGALLVCLDDDITLEVVEGIGKLKEQLQPETVHVVLKDAGLKDDVVKTNAIQLLKRYDINDVKTL